MDVFQLIQQKLIESGLDQRDLADAVEVTESYISQLLTRKKMPPAPERTDIIAFLDPLIVSWDIDLASVTRGCDGQVFETYRDRSIYYSGNCRVFVTSLPIMNHRCFTFSEE